MKKCIVTVLLACLVLAGIAGIAWAAEEPAVLSVDNSDLVFTQGSMAYCPVCGEAKLWTKLTDTQALKFEDGDHYYLAEDMSYKGTDFFLTAPGTDEAACLHLNGHNVTATNARAVQGSSGVLNIMGNGTVSGNYYDAANLWRGATLDINTSYAKGALNLYGGTYVKAEGSLQESVASVSNNGGILNLYAGATVAAAAGEHGIYVSTLNNLTGKSAKPILGIYGGEITSGDVYFNGLTDDNTKEEPATFKLAGGQISEGIAVLGNTDVILSGDPVVDGSGLQLAAGITLDLSKLTDGAQIAVEAVDVFTDASGEAGKQYLKPAIGTDCIIENEDGSLSYFSNAPLAFAEDGETAYCPACKENVVWAPLGEGDRIGTVASGIKHYYVKENLSYTGSKAYMTLQADETASAQVCLHTNGHNISSKGRLLVGRNATFNIMGTGSVCSSDENGKTGTLYLSFKEPVINIYGGNVVATGAYPAIYSVTAGKINLHGGIVDGNNTAQSVVMTAGEFTMYDGVIQNGKATEHGGNISLAGATFTLKGGEIKNGTAEKSGGNILVDTGAILNIDGGEISGGTATGQGGNIRVNEATVNMTGGIIRCGTGGSNAHNIWLVDSEMDMSGGIVYGASNAQAKDGSAIKFNKNNVISTLTLSGDATVIGEDGTLCGNIYIFGTTAKNNVAGKLIVEEGWTGTASVAWGDDYTCGTVIDKNYGESTGAFTGNLVYEGDQLLGIAAGDDNTLVITGVSVHKADGSHVWTKDAAAAIDLHLEEADSFIRTTVDGMTFELPENEAVYIDFNGKTANVTGKGTLCGMDSQNDTYAVSAAAATVTEDVIVQTDVTGGANGYRYIALTDGNTVTFHRLNVRLGAVSLRTSAAGLYYKARYSCDAYLARRVCAYGVALSLQDMPGADFADVSTDCYSYLDSDLEVNAENGYTVEATSCSVFGIFKTEEQGRTPELNAQYGETPIYANPYVMVKTHEGSDKAVTLVGDNANAGKQAGTAWSLFDMVKAINDNWTKYEEVQEKVIAFYEQWEKLGMDQWAMDLINIAPMKSYLEVLPLNEGEDYASFNVYLPAGPDYYAQYHFAYQLESANDTVGFGDAPNESYNSDLYRIKGAYIGSLRRKQFASEFRALSDLEIGFAVREKGAGDFCGGFHGDELMTAVSLTVDGKNISLNEERFTAFETLDFDLTTEIFRCNTPGVKLAEHTQNYRIRNNTIDLDQTIAWVTDAMPLQAAYAPMLTAQRLDPAHKSRILTDTVEFYKADGTSAADPFDTTSYGSTGDQTKVLEGLAATAVKVYGKESGFAAEAGYTVLDNSIPAAQQAASLVVRFGSALDNKAYFDLGSNAQPVAGETWKTQVYYRLTYTP